MKEAHPGAAAPLNDWADLLGRALPLLLEVLADPGPHARELRHVTPFAGVLSAAERSQVIRDFAAAEERAR